MADGLRPGSPDTAGIVTADGADPVREEGRRSFAVGIPAGAPLAVILIAQAFLSARLLRADTAFQDEGAYLWAGHLEWSHWLHGTAIPPFPAYYSGAPAIYPALGALADHLAGLTGARVLSLIFMLGTTVLLYLVAKGLACLRAAFFAGALFAVAAPTVFIGAFATFDALATFLVAAAMAVIIRAGSRRDAARFMIAAAVLLALANATAYATGLYDPVVIALAIVTGFPRPGGRLAVGRGLIVLAIMAVLVTGGLLLGGDAYLHGIDQTTLLRAGGTDGAVSVLRSAWSWAGIIVVIAWIGVAVSFITKEAAPRIWLLAVLAVAALLAPAEQASIHTVASLNKHVDFGIWCAAVPAGLRGRPTHPRGRRRPLQSCHGGRVRGRARIPARSRPASVRPIRNGVAGLDRLRQDPRTTRGPQFRAAAGRGPWSSGVLPAC